MTNSSFVNGKREGEDIKRGSPYEICKNSFLAPLIFFFLLGNQNYDVINHSIF